MTSKISAYEQTCLVRAREELFQEISNLHDTIHDEVDMEPDEADEQITEHETAAILIAILEQRLCDIEHALASLKTGEYAQCERCGEQIEPARLLAKPAARYCITCQHTVERIVHHTLPQPSFEFGF